jgi:hypothetical protein
MQRYTAPVRPRDGGPRSALTIAVILVVLIATAIVKPWNASVVAPIRVAASQAPLTPGPSATPGPPTEQDLVAPFCLQPSGWRVYAAERWSDRDVRSWRSAEVTSRATRPEDIRIPVTPLASQQILLLGYCAPVSGPEKPPTDVDVSVFRLPDRAEGPPIRLTLMRVQPVLRASSLGGVYAPPDSSGPAEWKDGTYVFRIGAPGRNAYVRWLAVRIHVTPRAFDEPVGENPATPKP